ncbi:signal peptidase I [uncultured Lactobacillus sp.]|uniref:signal peptidase I n=1 Tax=uncultured Lactobacillus sp. TaxID=153152 RepID=UPI0026233F2D|nr:signal peptidase I [uncultured Lactobacillus sp.]
MKNLKPIWSWILPIILGIVSILFIKQFIVQPVSVAGPSMMPNLVNNEKVLCFKFIKPRRGAVIVFNAKGVDPEVLNDKMYVKRVIGLPGDTISYKAGNIYVNDQKIDQSYLNDFQRTTGTSYSRADQKEWDLNSLYKDSIKRNHKWLTELSGTKVPKDSYFVLGDNRAVSNDSRNIGFVPRSNVLGVVKVPFWAKNNMQRSFINKQWKKEPTYLTD